MRPSEMTAEAREAAMLPWDERKSARGPRTEVTAKATEGAGPSARADERGAPPKRRHATLYRSAALEAFTIAPPWLPYVVLGPLAIAVLAPALGALPLWRAALELVLGALAWTLVEYLMHRFLFHARAVSEPARVVLLIVHGHHHVWPDDPRRVAATPLQFGSLALLFWGVFSSTLPRFDAHAVFAGFLFSYLAYEALHYAAHHGRTREGLLAVLRRHHMQHHHEDPRSRWGIGTPLWDHVLGTRGEKRESDAA